jgi:hypothetical protein
MPTPSPSSPPEDADRNLLFGVLCLQADLITEAQFAEACSLWCRRRQVPDKTPLKPEAQAKAVVPLLALRACLPGFCPVVRSDVTHFVIVP